MKEDEAAIIRRAAALDWTPSPDGAVERKRYLHVGAPESGVVTSLVRYRPGARFPRHPHPDGEEILVLEGTFSDHTGDFPTGAHLLNPQGFSHAPWSAPGCLLFVKLRQYAGSDRSQQVLCTNLLPWQREKGGAERLLLHCSRTPPEERLLVRQRAGTRWTPDTERSEVFVVSGRWRCGATEVQAHDWLQVPGGMHMECINPGTLYISSRCTA